MSPAHLPLGLLQATVLAAALAASPGAAAQSGWLEAEAADLVGVRFEASAPGFSGTGYATGFDAPGDAVRFEANVPAGVYDVVLRYATPFGQKGFDLSVAGVASSGMFPASAGAFAEHRAGTFRLPGGPATVVVGRGWGYFHLDALRLVPAVVAPPRTPPDALSDAVASPSARALVRFLRSEYGRRVLSGQQSMPDLEYVYGATGRMPAVGVFDLMDYSPSRVARGVRPETTPAQMTAWAGRRGVVSLSWHWNAPTDLLDTPDHEWWRGFYTHATTFDVEAALADPTSERYRLLLRDIDAIAVQLQALEDADVPVLWRPLHEAWGRWFWWGAKGPEPFKALWRLTHDRMTRVHGLHNLVWVYTHQDPAWYPGDDVVDVVSRDTYGAGEAAATQRAEWQATQAMFDGRKLVALSEAGGLHDPANSREFGVWWSWFSVWSGRSIRDAPQATLRAVYADEAVLTLDELPDWRAAPVAAETSAAAPAATPAISVFPTPARSLATVRVALSAPSDAVLSVFDLAGRRVLVRPLGRLGAGLQPVALDVSALPTGVYVVRLDAAGAAGPVRSSARLVVVR